MYSTQRLTRNGEIEAMCAVCCVLCAVRAAPGAVDLVQPGLSKKQWECLIFKKQNAAGASHARGLRSGPPVKLSAQRAHWRRCADQRSHPESLILSELELPGSRRTSTPGGIGARHRLRGGFGRSKVLSLIDGAQLRDIRVSDTQCTSALDPSHHPAACFSRAAAAHLQWSDRAAGSALTLRSRP